MFYVLRNKTNSMQDMTLAFPDSHTMAEFVIGKNVGGVVVDSNLNTVRGDLSEGLIATACNEFQASLLRNMVAED
jgi:hypothetical protein